jgi:hypothetical protein
MSSIELHATVPIVEEASPTNLSSVEESLSKAKSSNVDLESLTTKGLLRFLTRAKKRRAVILESLAKIDETIREATNICSKKAVNQLMQTQKPTI